MMQAAPPPPPAPVWSAHSLMPQKKRSYVLQRDFKVLEREQKVTTLLGREAFRSELENILRGQLEGTGEPKRTRPLSPGAISPGRSDLAGHKSRHPSSAVTSMMGGGGGGEPIIPINDLRGADASKYTVAERDQRCKLAAVYRLVHMFGWSQLIYNHITACAPGEDNTYLVNAFGLLYPEVTASNLVRVNTQGDVLDPGSTRLGINKDGFVLHSAIHEARSDVKCVIHLHTNAGIAISSMSCGLLPVSSEAIGLKGISYHNLEDYSDEDDDYERHQTWREKLTNDLCTDNKVLVLRNHGLVAMGSTVEEAFHIAHKLVKACEIQVALMSAGLGNILQFSPQAGVWSCSVGVACMGGVGGACTGSIGSNPRKWRVGDLEFEALMRMLDNKGYNTGYRYKGLGLLEPSTGTPTINRKDAERQAEKSQDHWDFLDAKKLAPDEPLTKAKYLGHTRTVHSRNDDPHTPKVSSKKPHGASDEGLTPLQHVQLTARQVAQSTGEAVEQLSFKGNNLHHDDCRGRESESLTPLQRAQQTAKEVAESTGEAVERLGSKINGMERNYSSPSKSGATTRHQYATPKRNVAPDARKLEPTEHNLSPLQRTKLTAKRVAKSTGKSLQKLTYSTEHANRSMPQQKQNGHQSCYWQREGVSSVSMESGGRSSRQKHTLLTNGSHTCNADVGSSTADSESELSDSECSGSVSSETSRLAAPGHSESMDFDHKNDGVSSFEKVKRTAEIVSKSTGVAVQKLSTSLSESV